MDSAIQFTGKELMPTHHQEMMSPQINELASALAKAQGEIHAAEKNAENDHFRNSYADLAAVWSACREPLSRNGLSVVQAVLLLGGDYYLITTLMHSSGQWQRGSMPLLLVKKDMQGLGSAVTYARRYSLSAMVGVAQADDDGEGSVNRKEKPEWKQEARSESAMPVGPRILPPVTSRTPTGTAFPITGAPTPRPLPTPVGAKPVVSANVTPAELKTPAPVQPSAEWHPGLPELAAVKGYMGGTWDSKYFNEYIFEHFRVRKLSELNSAQYHTLINKMAEDHHNRLQPPHWTEQDEPFGGSLV